MVTSRSGCRKAYEVVAKGRVVKLDMGGTVFEGSDDEGGRRFTTSDGGNYLLERKGKGLEIAVEGKPTWRVAFAGDGLVLSSDDTKITIAKAGAGHRGYRRRAWRRSFR